MRNALSVDVEDWFQVGAFEKVIARDAWETLPRRVDRVSEPLGESEDLRVRAIGGGLRFGTHPSISGR